MISIPVQSTTRSLARLITLALPLLYLLGNAMGQSLTWTGLVSSDWNNPTNWTPQQVPTSADVAVINSGTVNVATNAQFLELNLNGGALTGPVVVRSNAIFNWKKGRLLASGSLTVQSNGVVNVQTGSQKYCDGALTNHGTVVWTGGTFTIRNNNAAQKGQVVNLGLWEMQGDLALADWYNNGLERFSNGGIFRKASGSGRGNFNAVLDNQFGTLEVQSGTLRFDRGPQLDGLFIVGLGAVMELHGGTATYTELTRLTGEGQYRLTGGTLQGLLDYIPNLRLLGGSVGLSPNYQTNGTIERLDLDGSTLIGSNAVSGILNLNKGGIGGPTTVAGSGVLNWAEGNFGAGSSLTVQSNGVVSLFSNKQKQLGGALTNSGSVYWSGGRLYLRNDASSYLGAVENQPGGLWEVQGDLTLSQWVDNNNAYFRNQGILRKTTGTKTATMDVVFSNQGVVEQLSGIWTFGRNFSLTEGTVLFGMSGDSAFGRINLTGTASLAGGLAARLLDGYVPATNRTFQVMSYGVVSGTFTDTSGLDVGFGRFFTPVYDSTSLTLQTHWTNSPAEPTPILLSEPVRDLSGFSFLFTGDPGTNYTVQFSTNLSQTNWSTLLVTNIPVSPAKVIDTNTAAPNQFYRVLKSVE